MVTMKGLHHLKSELFEPLEASLKRAPAGISGEMDVKAESHLKR
jgi:hypothetical protein